METKRLAKFLVVLLSFLIIGLIKTQTEAVNTFGIFREKSYYFGNTFKLNWHKAVEYCRARGMFLVSINNGEELDGVVEYIEKSGYTKTRDFLTMWTSANDLGEEGEFFLSSTGQRLTFDRWTKNEPNNMEHDNCTFEHCVVLQHYLPFGHNYTFDDRPCNFDYFFMCESQKFDVIRILQFYYTTNTKPYTHYFLNILEFVTPSMIGVKCL